MYGRKDLLKNAITTGPGASVDLAGLDNECNATYQAVGATSAGAGTAEVDIEVSNDNENWILLGTISLTLSDTPATDGFASAAAWLYVRANITALTGTDASVNVIMGA
jgi:hypothetical protein